MNIFFSFIFNDFWRQVTAKLEFQTRTQISDVRSAYISLRAVTILNRNGEGKLREI